MHNSLTDAEEQGIMVETDLDPLSSQHLVHSEREVNAWLSSGNCCRIVGPTEDGSESLKLLLECDQIVIESGFKSCQSDECLE